MCPLGCPRHNVTWDDPPYHRSSVCLSGSKWRKNTGVRCFSKCWIPTIPKKNHWFQYTLAIIMSDSIDDLDILGWSGLIWNIPMTLDNFHRMVRKTSPRTNFQRGFGVSKRPPIYVPWRSNEATPSWVFRRCGASERSLKPNKDPQGSQGLLSHSSWLEDVGNKKHGFIWW